MLTDKISHDKVEAVKNLIARSGKIVIICHMTPDGDAMGSSLALYDLLKRKGKNVFVVTPDMPPRNLMFLPGAQSVVVGSRYPDKAHNLLLSADLIVCLDFNSLHRVDRLSPFVSGSSAKKILIDHHLEPENFVDVLISCPEKSSTCALLYELLGLMGMSEEMSREAAECIYTGMMTDTGNFSYNSNDPQLYLIIAELLKKGIDKDSIYNKAWNTNSSGRLRLCGYALYCKMQLVPDHKMALIALSRDELNEFDYVKGDTEGLVNKPLSIPGIEYSVFLREDEPDYVKVSMRSLGDFPVNKICSDHFGGGGHLNAAGGEFHGSLASAMGVVMSVLPDYDEYLNNNNIE